jgi:D-3-phosphoglycerate dehydrogenase
MLRFARDADGLIVGADPVTRGVLEGAGRLRIVAKHGAGVDNIDLPAAAARRVAVTYAPGGNARSVAEMALALLLALSRGIPRADARMRARRWEHTLGREVAGQTLGILGLGRIGRQTAVLARALGMEVLAYDIAQDQAFAQAQGVSYESLRTVLERSDAVCVHVPLTPETRGLLGAEQLSWMRREAVLINVARGGVVDESALAAALREGRLAGAAVDVFAQEPPWNSPLLDLENVVLTPHMAHSTAEALERVDLMIAQDVAAVLHGEEPANRVTQGGSPP